MKNKDLPVAFIPAICCRASMYSEIIELLETNVYPVLVDLPDLDDITAIAEYYISRIPKGSVLVGSSMGGYIALECNRIGSEHLSGLVLVATKAGTDSLDMLEKRHIANRIVASQEDFMKFWRRLIFRCFHNAHSDPKLRDSALNHIFSTRFESFHLHNIAMSGRPDYGLSIGNISVPTLVIAGTGDVVITPQVQKNMADEIPGSDYAEIHCGHLPWWEAPEELSAVLDNWISECFSHSLRQKRRSRLQAP